MVRFFNKISIYQVKLFLVTLSCGYIISKLDSVFTAVMSSFLIGFIGEILHAFCPMKEIKIMNISFSYPNLGLFKKQLMNNMVSKHNHFNESNYKIPLLTSIIIILINVLIEIFH